ncbi:hypothetical protein Pmani_006636 [Petrolisthes manimaculis]|uniref:Uncharacterized protein n=1 Tax=Petrolisthes manimaculis TaxID=1843537 RepID=A0AAE1Q9H2_9EUCA|nr:hypothetical protein Pmani_006636 [Petrolisthes manimaculis]
MLVSKKFLVCWGLVMHPSFMQHSTDSPLADIKLCASASAVCRVQRGGLLRGRLPYQAVSSALLNKVNSPSNGADHSC